MTVNTRVIKILLHSNNMSYVEIQEGLRIQVIPDVSYLVRCQKHQFAAFVADWGVLIVWDDEPRNILSRVERLEAALMKKIWGNESTYPQEAEKKGAQTVAADGGGDVEAAEEKTRHIVLMQSWLTAATLALTVTALGAGWRQIAVEIAVDKNYLRIVFLVAIIPQFWLALVSSFNLPLERSADDKTVLLPSSGRKRRANDRPH